MMQPSREVVSREVVKLGGSLIEYAELIPNLRRWLSRQRGSHQVLIVGGGKLADQIREQFQSGKLTESEAHDRAVRCMTENTERIAGWMPEVELESEYDALLARLPTPGITLLSTQSYLNDDETRLPGKRLPRTWDATSDSIAARLAITIKADRLTLLKSSLPKRFDGIRDLPWLADQGYIDLFLPELKDELPPLGFANLRDSEALFASRT